MDLTRQNIEIFAARHYLNEFCVSREDFEEDFRRFSSIKKMVKRIKIKKETNIRLLCNHVLCCANVFELNAMKKILFFNLEEEDKEIMKTLLNYFGFIRQDEMKDVKFSLTTAKLLKEMD